MCDREYEAAEREMGVYREEIRELKAQHEGWGKELLKLNKERDRALEALRDAVKVIHDWHNMNTLPTDVDTWKIYYDNSPEMEKVRSVLSWEEKVMADEVKRSCPFYEDELCQPACALWSARHEMCAISTVAGVLKARVPDIAKELQVMNTTLISIENKLDARNNILAALDLEEKEREEDETTLGDLRRGVTMYSSHEIDNHLDKLDELVRRASIAYWFLVGHFPAQSGYIDPLKPAIEAVTGEELRRE